MRKKLLIAAGIVVGLLAALAAFIALQPNEYKVSRTATINASPAEVFAQVNDFHKWDAWTPWMGDDPQAKVSFEGPESGQGAIFRWNGNKNVGEGSMTILESQPHEKIDIKLEFLKPMAGVADCGFTFKPDGDKTVVTWWMHGKSDFSGKAVCLVINMDKMIGGKYEQGLAKLKNVVEKK